MKLNLPEQSKPAANATPNDPRKLKKVLAALPSANMGELTRQTYTILKDLNRQTMLNRHRLENMEMLRVTGRGIFDNLKKYFINRTLPLPEKSQKIVNLNQSLLRELAYGYEIIVYEAANKIDPRIDKKTLCTAICRAMYYLSEMYLRACEVYTPCPKDLWYEIHQLYVYAKSAKLTDIAVPNNELTVKKVTIDTAYKQILLFSLARPIALRQRDSERVYNELFEWSRYATIGQTNGNSESSALFVINVDKDLPPNYLDKSEISGKDTVLTLNASALVAHVTKIKEEQEIKQRKHVAVGNVIPVEALELLINAWGISAKRHFSRAEQKGHINVSISLTSAVKAISDSYRVDHDIDSKSGFFRNSGTSRRDSDFTLQAIPHHDDGVQRYTTHTEISSAENNSWDMVAKGRALTETYTREQQKLNDDLIKKRQNEADAYWEIVNISPGGYCLRWNSDDTSKAQIGEIIVMQIFDASRKFHWHAGVIRWMQFTQENGLEIGVQVIAPKVLTASAQRVNRPNELPFDCLMLPEIKTLEQPPTIILPSHAFKPGDKLTVKVKDSKMGISLDVIREHTGSFTQFAYKNTEEVQKQQKQTKKEEASTKKDDFDELWSSL